MKHQVLLVSALAVAICCLFVAPVAADTVQPGHDLWVTPPGTASHNFVSEPIPADFFGPGSDPFDGIVALNGKALGNFGGFNIGSAADTIVQRPVPLDDGIAGQIELVALSLVSVDPITVTYNGGQDPEEWDVAVSLNPTQQSLGQMTITHPSGPGGTFVSNINVFPRFTFTRSDQGAGPIVLDAINAVGMSSAGASAWSHTPDGVIAIAGLTGPNFYPIETHLHTGPHPQVNPDTNIPTVSEWGMLAMVLLALAAGTVVFRRSRRQVA